MSATTTMEAVSYPNPCKQPSVLAKSLEGSTTVYPYNDAAYEPLELGAFIFVEANMNLQRAVHEFNLSLYLSRFEVI